jgi:hypothetical protein
MAVNDWLGGAESASLEVQRIDKIESRLEVRASFVSKITSGNQYQSDIILITKGKQALPPWRTP